MHHPQDIGGIQIDVFPLYDTGFVAQHGERKLNIYKTPKQLGLRPGSHISYLDNPSQYPFVYSYLYGGEHYQLTKFRKVMSSLLESYSPKSSQVELRGIYGREGCMCSSLLPDVGSPM